MITLSKTSYQSAQPPPRHSVQTEKRMWPPVHLGGGWSEELVQGAQPGGNNLWREG